ncbi:hypothetical protein [Helicobacter anseris]|uniref:hypothetical protein n=1 Tax=Helicobacter anseris TaxID=375926 RepID=UPI0014746D1C|nr:hypothetical protein [Helicobacter anseris]
MFRVVCVCGNFEDYPTIEEAVSSFGFIDSWQPIVCCKCGSEIDIITTSEEEKDGII